MTNIKSLTPEQISEQLTALNLPRYRTEQIIRWLYGRGVSGFHEMSDLPLPLRSELAERYALHAPQLAEKQTSDDGTVKYLWRLNDGNAVESVLLRYDYGNSICVSTQAGCKMGCTFCASPPHGFSRNLSFAEILDQILFAQRDSGLQISRVDLMGIGEPLDNFDNVLSFLKLVNDPLFAPGGRAKGSPLGLNIGMRHISISTCGPPGGIERLMRCRLQCNLLVSLHAPDDATRSRLMPINRAEGVDKLLADCKRYSVETGRRVSFEYALIKGVNDSDAQAESLAEKIKAVGGHINIIRLNEASPQYSAGDVHAFCKKLITLGANATVRRTLGADISAACGQLRVRGNIF
ncbi:MAG: 23S rRNA (adenine(2503)-C(2))-methyltransferase RlmN [Oscillospiraceae bacterium]|jgi:23S rRNA (adenine2503-C2)-methyltransferase|nr:23S rRNA (adenine(2503)-C(2))-methyltransferase RlmN [Oscillospiraceae bacterium]